MAEAMDAATPHTDIRPYYIHLSGGHGLSSGTTHGTALFNLAKLLTERAERTTTGGQHITAARFLEVIVLSDAGSLGSVEETRTRSAEHEEQTVGHTRFTKFLLSHATILYTGAEASLDAVA